ncbi:MAG: dienelactone hydrolase family protein [Gammaproteobacteria bacterium]|nr:dienelactone hydrolase family protein [Gammaproteobacteria bacterium]
MNDTLLPCVELETGANPTAAVIWLHGLGADGHDFEAIVPELGLPASLPLRFIFPHAPVRPITLNGGYPMRAWYDIAELNFLNRKEDEKGIRDSEAEVHKLIRRENARGIPASRIVLAGFSQGGAVTLHTGLRYPERLAGLMALSTYLPLAEKAEGERHAANAETPIFMAHGTADNIVPFMAGEVSKQRLEALGYGLEFHSYPMQHAVHPREIADIAGWLKRVLA